MVNEKVKEKERMRKQ